MKHLKILLIDDEPSMLITYDTLLRMKGVTNIVSSQDPIQALDIARNFDPDVILLDLMMGEHRGQDFIEPLARVCTNVNIIIVSALDTIETAVECIRSGAMDYLVKPLQQDRLLELLEQVSKGPKAPEGQHEESEMVYQSSIMQRVITQMEVLAPTKLPILITGETGTGKELMAKAIHHESGVKGPLVSVNVAGLDENMFSDTLFGHCKGSFTGANHQRDGLIRNADGGTLFLDEIGDLDAPSQIKMLRLLQEGEFYPVGSDQLERTNARFVLATHVHLAKKVEQGTFRQDLYYRLNSHRIHLPPLRDRKEDISFLAQKMNQRLSEDLGKATFPIPPHLLEIWTEELFPGNVRELEGRVRHGILFGFNSPMPEYSEISGVDMGHHSTKFTVDDENGEAFPTIKKMTERLVQQAMEASGHKQVEAAKLLGISQQALSARLKKMNT